MDVWGLRALVCVFVVIGLVAVGPTAVAAESAAGTGTQTGAGDPVLLQDDSTEPLLQDNVSAETALENADRIHVRIDIAENGSATVRVDYQYELEGQDATVDWDELEDDVESDPDSYVDEESQSWQETLDRAENETDRGMNLSEFTVATDNSSTPVSLGHVQFGFEWTSFASVELNRIEAGDSLAGFALVDNTQLLITWPDGYNATAIEPEPTTLESTAASWSGDQSAFDDPKIELLRNGTESAGEDDPDLDRGLLGWGGAAAIGVVAVFALFVLVERSGWRPGRGPEESSSDLQSAGTGGVESTVESQPPQLLSNEERVLQLLEQRGGRLKQQQVVAELEWTEAKTSQVVSDLRESGEVDVFRIGRENVLVLADEDE